MTSHGSVVTSNTRFGSRTRVTSIRPFPNAPDRAPSLPLSRWPPGAWEAETHSSWVHMPLASECPTRGDASMAEKRRGNCRSDPGARWREFALRSDFVATTVANHLLFGGRPSSPAFSTLPDAFASLFSPDLLDAPTGNTRVFHVSACAPATVAAAPAASSLGAALESGERARSGDVRGSAARRLRPRRAGIRNNARP